MEIIKAKFINEFTRGSDPLDTLGIGYTAKIHKFFDDLDIKRNQYTIEDKQIIFKTDLEIENCPNLVELPDNLTILGNLRILKCHNLTKLPNNLKINDNLYLIFCTGLEKLTNKIYANNHIIFQKCTNLVELPNNLRVHASLKLSGCTSLTELPNNLRIYSYLDLEDCTNLVKLPDDLFVKGNIYIKAEQIELINWLKTSKFKDKFRIEKY